MILIPGAQNNVHDVADNLYALPRCIAECLAYLHGSDDMREKLASCVTSTNADVPKLVLAGFNGRNDSSLKDAALPGHLNSDSPDPMKVRADCFARRKSAEKFTLLVALVTALALPLRAELAGFDFETRVWRADNGQDSGWVIGPEFSLRLPESLIVRARYEQGTFNAGGDVEKMEALQFDAGWLWRFCEFGAGFEHLAIDTSLQPGWAWSYPTEEAERNADIYGPLVYVRAGQKFGSLPVGWRAAAAWMFKDFGGMNDLGYDGSHADIEAALTYDHNRLGIAAGYRLVQFSDLPPRDINGQKYGRDTLDGAFASLTFRF